MPSKGSGWEWGVVSQPPHPGGTTGRVHPVLRDPWVSLSELCYQAQPRAELGMRCKVAEGNLHKFRASTLRQTNP